MAGLRDAGLPNIPCLAHTLQLVIKDGCLAQTCVTNLTGRARKLVGHYKHSNLACKTLERIQEQLGCPKHRLIQDEPTRWNTTYYMLERLLEQRMAVTAANVELNVPVELQSSHWTLAEKVVQILKIFEEATVAASSDHASASIVIPIVNSIIRSLETEDNDSGVSQMKRQMLVSLHARFADIESNKLYVMATILDPRFKQRVFSTASSAALAKQMLISEYEALSLSVVTDTSSTQPTKRSRVDKAESVLWQYCDEIIENTSSESSASQSIDMILDNYLKEPNEPRHSSSLIYWKKYHTACPILSSLALKYLSSPSSTVASERLFSQAGNILTESRNRLSPDRLDMLLFLNRNLHLVNFDY